jgi:hypothetical protein
MGSLSAQPRFEPATAALPLAFIGLTNEDCDETRCRQHDAIMLRDKGTGNSGFRHGRKRVERVFNLTRGEGLNEQVVSKRALQL